MKFCCCFSTTQLRQDMDKVDESTTEFAKHFDTHTAEIRTVFQELLSLFQESLNDGADDKEHLYYREKIETLCLRYVKSETDLDALQNAALLFTERLLQHFPSKRKKTDGSYETRLLENYLKVNKTELPVLSGITKSDVNTQRNKDRDLEKKVVSNKNDTIALDSKINESTKENQKLKPSVSSEVADNKKRKGPGRTELREDELPSLKKPLLTEEERMVKRQDSTSSKRKLGDIDGTQKEYVSYYGTQNSNNDNKVKTKNSELNEKLQKSEEDKDTWKKRTLQERSKNEQIIQKKAAIEKEMNEISRKLKVKIDEEKQLKDSLESRSAMINEEQCISKKLKEEKEALMREKDKFQELLNEKHAEIDDYESRLEELSNLSSKIEHDASETEKKLKKKIYGLEQDLKKETEQNKQLKSQVKVLSEKITNLETEIRNEQEKNANKETKIETAALQLKDVTKNYEELKLKLVQAEENTRSELEKSNAKIADLIQDKTSLAKQLTGLKDNMQDLQTTLTTQKTTYEAKISDLMHNMEQLQEKKLEAEKTLAALEEGHRELQQLYETAKEELDQFKRIKTIQIQLYYNSRSSLISKVENELKSLLKREIESNTTQLEFFNREKVNDIDPSEPLLIICICASRLGTDAANAVQSLKLTSNMALLVFHHKDGHALPNQASEHVLTGNEYKRLGGIFDFGFLSGKGIYSCEMNDQNFRNIVHFIRKEH